MKPDEKEHLVIHSNFNDAERIVLTNIEDGQFFDIAKDGNTIKISGSYSKQQLSMILWLMYFAKDVEKKK